MPCEGTESMKDMMSQMMKGCSPEMITGMMTHSVGAMFQHLPKEKRTDFVLKTIATLMEKGADGMSDSEKKDFREKVIEKVKG